MKLTLLLVVLLTPPRPSFLLPHREEFAPRVQVAGFSERYHSANCGWVSLKEETLLIDLPRGIQAKAFLNEVGRLTGKPVHRLVLSGLQAPDIPLVESFLQSGVREILSSAEVGTYLLKASKKIGAGQVKTVVRRTAIGDEAMPVDLFPFDRLILLAVRSACMDFSFSCAISSSARGGTIAAIPF
jgi:hypothetical protein